MTFLRDPIWQAIGAVLALVALWAVVHTYRRQHLKRLEIRYRASELPHLGELGPGAIEVLVNGTTAHNLYFILIRVVNAGRAPILPADYLVPLTLEFGDKAFLLTFELSSKKPRDLVQEVTIVNDTNPLRGRHLELVPALLNPGDEFEISCLLEGRPRLAAHARIVGVSKIEVREELAPLRDLDALDVVVTGVAVATVMALAAFPSLSAIVFPLVRAFLLVAVAMAFTRTTMHAWNRTRRRSGRS